MSEISYDWESCDYRAMRTAVGVVKRQMPKGNDQESTSKKAKKASAGGLESIKLVEEDSRSPGLINFAAGDTGTLSSLAPRDREENGQSHEPLASGDVVGGHYQIERELGVGGMSTVYRAQHLLLNRTVALKVLNETRSTDPKSVQRFQQEAKVISQLDHPSIVRLHEFGIDQQDRPYLVMDLVEGQSLEQLIKSKGKLGPKEALEIAVDVAEALDHAHEKGIIHRDLKPSNIVLEKGPSGRMRAKVVDFGIAKLISNSGSQKLTQTGDTFGSPTYMSPEQCMGKETDPRTDIYSLACVIVEMLTGKPLFEADMPIQVLAKHLNEKPQRLSSMKALQAERRQWTRQEATMMAALDRVLAKALSKNADDRYRNAAEFAQDLLIVITDPASLAKNLPLYISHLERKSLFGQSSYMVMGILACALIYLLAFTFYGLNPNSGIFQPPQQAYEAPPPEPTLPLPPVKVLPPTTYKPAKIMFFTDFVFDGIPVMHAYADTLKSYTQSLQAQQAKGWATSQDQLQLARDSLSLGRVMVDSGNAKAAINEFSRVIALQDLSEEEQKNHPDFSLDNTVLQSGWLGLGDARMAMGNYAEALEAYLKARDFYTRGDIFDDKLKQGLLLRRISLCYEALGGADAAKKAKEYAAQASELLLIKDPQNAIDRKIIALAALADGYLHQGQYHNALDAYDDAMALAKDLPGDYAAANAAQIAILQCKRAFCLGLLGQSKGSYDLFDRALDDLRANRPDETYLQNTLKPRILFAKAILLDKQATRAAALKLAEQAVAQCRVPERDVLGLKMAIIQFGLRLASKMNNPEEITKWRQYLADIQPENATSSILPNVASTQYNAEQIFNE